MTATMPSILSEQPSQKEEEFILIDQNGILNAGIEEEIKKPEYVDILLQRKTDDLTDDTIVSGRAWSQLKDQVMQGNHKV